MSTFTVTIEPKTKATKYLIGLIKEMSKNSKYVVLKTDITEDDILAKEIESGLKTEIINEIEVMKALEL